MHIYVYMSSHMYMCTYNVARKVNVESCWYIIMCCFQAESSRWQSLNTCRHHWFGYTCCFLLCHHILVFLIILLNHHFLILTDLLWIGRWVDKILINESHTISTCVFPWLGRLYIHILRWKLKIYMYMVLEL